MSVVMKCPECSGKLARKSEETHCPDCGLVVSEHPIDPGPEWRSFEDDSTDRRRTGSPLTRSRHDRGLGSTEIGNSRNIRLTGRKRRRIARMRREHSRAQFASKAERNQMEVFTEIRRLSARFSLPDAVRDQACDLFRAAQRENIVRGRSLEGFAAAAVYASCRMANLSRTIDEVVNAARASEPELRAAYDALNRELGLAIGPIDPREYIPRFASRLDLPPFVEETARILVREISETGLIGGRNPSGVAGACLYAAAKEHEISLTQKRAAEVAGVSPVTLRSTYHDLIELDLAS